MHVLIPAGLAKPPSHRPAPRLRDLRGKTIGLLDNAKPNADRLLGAIADRLVSDHGVQAIVRFRKRISGVGATAETLESLSRCDGVFTGTGD
jgi:hypothetical protein